MAIMIDLAPGLRLLPSRPAYAFNVYVAGGTIVDAGTRHAARRILGATRSLTITAHAVTHGHSDHQGSSAAIVQTLGVPFAAPAAEADALRAGDDLSLSPQNAITRWQARHWRGPGLHEPPARFTIDAERNRASIRRLAALRPRLVVFGHGRPQRDPDALERFAAALPAG